MQRNTLPINKDLDLRRFGKNIYTKNKGNGDGGSGSITLKTYYAYSNGVFDAPSGTAYNKVIVNVREVVGITDMTAEEFIGAIGKDNMEMTQSGNCFVYSDSNYGRTWGYTLQEIINSYPGEGVPTLEGIIGSGCLHIGYTYEVDLEPVETNYYLDFTGGSIVPQQCEFSGVTVSSDTFDDGATFVYWYEPDRY